MCLDSTAHPVAQRFDGVQKYHPAAPLLRPLGQLFRKVSQEPVGQLGVNLLRRHPAESQKILFPSSRAQPLNKARVRHPSPDATAQLLTNPCDNVSAWNVLKERIGGFSDELGGISYNPTSSEQRVVLDPFLGAEPRISQVELRTLDRELSPQLSECPRAIGVISRPTRTRLQVEHSRRYFVRQLFAEFLEKPGFAGSADTEEHDDW